MFILWFNSTFEVLKTRNKSKREMYNMLNYYEAQNEIIMAEFTWLEIIKLFIIFSINSLVLMLKFVTPFYTS